MSKLIYAFVEANSSPPELGLLLKYMQSISGTTLAAIRVNGVTAIVSDLNRADLVADKLSAIAYAGIIEELAKKFTVIPVRFPSFLGSSSEVEEMINRNLEGILDNFRKIENKSEFGLKIFCDKQVLKETLKQKDNETIGKPEGSELREGSPSVYREWVDKKLKEYQLEEQVTAYVNSILTVINESVEPIQAGCKFRKMVSETLILDAIFLVRKQQKTVLVEMVKSMEAQFYVLTFVLTGPWPAYSFVDFTVKHAEWQ